MSKNAKSINTNNESEDQPLLYPQVQSDTSSPVEAKSTSANATAPDDSKPKKKRFSIGKQQLMLLGYLAGCIIFGTCNRICFKMMGSAMPNYSFFLSNVSTFIYIPIFFAVTLYRIKFTKHITPEMRAFPKYKSAVMGLLDATAGVLLLFGNVHVSGPMQQLLNQGVIPLTMIASFIFLKERYKLFQYLGAAVILAGIGISFLDSVLYKSGASQVQNSAIWCVLYFSNNIPSALSGVYKEIAFKSQPMDIYYLNAWISLWQFIFGLLFFPIQFIKIFGGLTLKEIPYSLYWGAKCFIGINTIKNPGPNQVADNCAHGFGGLPVFIPVLMYLFFNIGYNIFLLLVLKYGSAALMYIASTVNLPLSNIAFYLIGIIPVFSATLGIKLHWPDYVGLIVILGGLIMYRLSGSSSSGPAEPNEEVIPVFGINQPEISHPVRHPKTSYYDENLIQPRDVTDIRASFYRRVGIMPPARQPQKMIGVDENDEANV